MNKWMVGTTVYASTGRNKHTGKSLSSAAGRSGKNVQAQLCSPLPASAFPRAQLLAPERPSTILTEEEKQAETCRDKGRIPSTPLMPTAQARNPKLWNGFPLIHHP